MDVRLLAAITGQLDGLNVSALCRERNVSTKTFYKWRARFAAEGMAGLEPRSRRPHRSACRTSHDTEEAVVRLRKSLAEEGHDAGPGTIQWHLGRQGLAEVPSEATIWRILVRRGFVVPEPHKRPKSATRRFVADFPNECWQIDATEVVIATGKVQVFNIIDDHSRLCVASLAVAAATTEAAWDAFSAATSRYGLPVRCLSDNGLCFSGKLRGFEVAFEAKLRAAGIRPVTARPYHPQTCGKVERFQQTLKKWLRRRRRLAADLGELQALLDRFVAYYNHERPHRGIGRTTPYERWSATAAATSPGVALAAPVRRCRIVVNDVGQARSHAWAIGLGVDYAGLVADIVTDGTHAAVYIDDHLVRYLTLDADRHYQPSGRPRGGARRRRPSEAE